MAKEEFTPISITKLGKHEQALFKQFSQAKTDDEAARIVSDPDFPAHAYDRGSQTPLMKAIKDDLHQTVEALVTQKRCPLDYQDKSGETALHKAVQKLNTSFANLLIEKGASLNIQNKSKQTPLSVALKVTNYKAAMDLVNAGAALDIQDKQKQTPLMQVLFVPWANTRSLALRMIEKGAPLDAKAHSDLTPLHLICLGRANGETLGIAMVERLKAEGNTHLLNQQDSSGKTPLLTAVEGGFENYAMALIDAGARMDIADEGYQLPLNVACYRRRDDLAEKMVIRGAPMGRDQNDLDHPLVVSLREGLEKTSFAILHKTRPEELPDYVISGCAINDALLEGMDQVVIELVKKGVPLTLENYRYSGLNSQVQEMLEQFVRHVILPQTIRQYPKLVNVMGEVSPSEDAQGQLQHHETFIENLVSDLQHSIFPEVREKDLEALNKEVAKIIKHNKQHPGAKKSLDGFLRNNPTMQQYLRLTRLAKTWHHPTINIPREYLPLSGSGEWHPIIDKPFAPDGFDGLFIKNLTSGADLKYESEKLDHCVGRHSGYDAKCMKNNHDERSHILSIGSMGTDGHRIPHSTIEMQVVDRDDDNKALTPIFGDSLHALKIVQHYGRNNTPPSSQAYRLLDAFLDGVKDGSVTLEMDNRKLGETSQSIKSRKQYSKLEQTMGMPLDWVVDPKSEGYSNLGKIYDRFRMSERAAITGTDRNGRRVYDETRTDDGYAHFNHFIDGWAKVDADGLPTGQTALHKKDLTLRKGQVAVSLRDLDLPNWMRASLVEKQIFWRLRADYPDQKLLLQDNQINFDRPPIPGEREPKGNRATIITHEGTIKPAPHELSAA